MPGRIRPLTAAAATLARSFPGRCSPSRTAAAATVQAHLAACDRCRLELAAVTFAAAELRSAAARPFADPAELPPLRLEPPAELDQERPAGTPGPLERPTRQRV